MERIKFISEAVPVSVQNYVAGWVQRKSDLVVSSMAQDGVYIDKPHPLIESSKMKTHLEDVAWINFPDMTFDTLTLFGNETERVYIWEWAMYASRCSIVIGGERNIYCEGVDILTLNSDDLIIQSVCHLDRKTLWDSVLS